MLRSPESAVHYKSRLVRNKQNYKKSEEPNVRKIDTHISKLTPTNDPKNMESNSWYINSKEPVHGKRKLSNFVS